MELVRKAQFPQKRQKLVSVMLELWKLKRSSRRKSAEETIKDAKMAGR